VVGVGEPGKLRVRVLDRTSDGDVDIVDHRREGASIVRVRDQIITCRVGGTRVVMRKEGGGLAGWGMQARGCSNVWVDPGDGV